MLRCTLLAQRGLRVATRLPRVRFAAPVRLRLLSSAFEAAPSAAASSELAEAADAAVLSKVAVVVATPPEEPAAAAAADEPPAAAAAAAEPPRQWPEGVAPSAGTTVAVVSPLFLKKRLVGYTLTPTDGSEAMLLFSRRQGHLIPNAEGRVGLCHGEHVEVMCEEKEHDGKMVREVTSVAGPHGGPVQGVPPKPRTPKSTDANAPRAWPDGVEPSAGASVAVVRPLILNKRHVGAVLKPLDGSADALLFFQKHKKLIPNAPGTQGLRYGEHVEVTSIEKEHKGKMVREVTSVAGPHGGPVQGTPTKPKSELKKAEASTAVPVAAAPAQTFDEYMAKNAGPIPPGVEEVEVHAVDAKGVAQVTRRHLSQPPPPPLPPPHSPPPPSHLQGRVTWFALEKGSGFIRTPLHEKEVFFAASNFMGVVPPQAGDAVEFKLQAVYRDAPAAEAEAVEAAAEAEAAVEAAEVEEAETPAVEAADDAVAVGDAAAADAALPPRPALMVAEEVTYVANFRRKAAWVPGARPPPPERQQRGREQRGREQRERRAPERWSTGAPIG